MIERNKIEAEVEKTLKSLDNISRAQANPFLFTRIRQKMMKEEAIWGKVAGYISRPAFAVVTICFVVLINAWILFNENNEDVMDGPAQQQQALSEVSEQYNLAISSAFYDYENP